MTKPLSPATALVLKASASAACLQEWSTVNDPPCHPSDHGWNGCYHCVNRPAIAAALRAAADEVAPFQSEDINGCWYEKRNPVREQLLAMADELEAPND